MTARSKSFFFYSRFATQNISTAVRQISIGKPNIEFVTDEHIDSRLHPEPVGEFRTME